MEWSQCQNSSEGLGDVGDSGRLRCPHFMYAPTIQLYEGPNRHRILYEVHNDLVSPRLKMFAHN